MYYLILEEFPMNQLKFCSYIQISASFNQLKSYQHSILARIAGFKQFSVRLVNNHAETESGFKIDPKL